MWSRPLADGGRAVILLNRGETTHAVKVRWQDIGYPEALKLRVRDLWKHQTLPTQSRAYEASVPAHGAVMVKLSME